MPGVTGSIQRIGLCVGSRPSHAGASTAGEPTGQAERAQHGQYCRHDRHPVARRCLLPGRCLPLRRALARPRSSSSCLGAIERSTLNAVSFVDPEPARAAAASADVTLPFGGVPVGVKELDNVEGWPATEASLVFKDRIATYTSTMVTRLVDEGGAVLVGQTTASEFGGLNVSTTRLNGTTHNPWQHGRTAGGSSGGSAAAVAGGLLPLAHGRRRRRVDPHPRRLQRARRA